MPQDGCPALHPYSSAHGGQPCPRGSAAHSSSAEVTPGAFPNPVQSILGVYSCALHSSMASWKVSICIFPWSALLSGVSVGTRTKHRGAAGPQGTACPLRALPGLLGSLAAGRFGGTAHALTVKGKLGRPLGMLAVYCFVKAQSLLSSRLARRAVRQAAPRGAGPAAALGRALPVGRGGGEKVLEGRKWTKSSKDF